MTISQAVEQLLEVEDKYNQSVYSANSIGVGLARVGSSDQKIVAGTLQELMDVDFGAPLHSFVLPGRMHFLEADILRGFAVNQETFNANVQIFS